MTGTIEDRDNLTTAAENSDLIAEIKLIALSDFDLTMIDLDQWFSTSDPEEILQQIKEEYPLATPEQIALGITAATSGIQTLIWNLESRIAMLEKHKEALEDAKMMAENPKDAEM